MNRILRANLEALMANVYPGRGIIVGLDEREQHLVQVYWIMGRSENSRNRVFRHESGRLFTESADPSKVKNPSLIIYNAMAEVVNEDGRSFVVSNGDQTDTVVNGLKNGKNLVDSLATRAYEPDAPNYTPRISALSMLQPWPRAMISILKKAPQSDECVREYYLYQESKFLPGEGHCVTTYAGDGDPLPAFKDEPYPVPLKGIIGTIANTYWAALNESNRVSLAVKFINKKSGESEIFTINKYQQV